MVLSFDMKCILGGLSNGRRIIFRCGLMHVRSSLSYSSINALVCQIATTLFRTVPHLNSRPVIMGRCLIFACVAICFSKMCTASASVSERPGCRGAWDSSGQCAADHKSSLLQMRQFAPQTVESALVEDSEAVNMPPAFEDMQDSATTPSDGGEMQGLKRVDMQRALENAKDMQDAATTPSDGGEMQGLKNADMQRALENARDMQDSPSTLSESGETQGLKVVDMQRTSAAAAESSTKSRQGCSTEDPGCSKQAGSTHDDFAVGHCNPQCMWKCDSPKCDEICKPICKPPKCETRCSGVSLKGCAMDCSQPHCAVLCPERMCAGKPNECKSCTTTCSEAMCKLRCSRRQPCQNVCEHPQCEWKCSAPVKCPPPKCKMWCETPKKCQGQGSTHKKLPQLKIGESAVKAFSANYQPAGSRQMLQPMDSVPEVDAYAKSFAQGSAGSAMQVPMVTAMSPESANQDEMVPMEPQLEHRMVEMPVM